jgi:hypothetical protein
LLNIPPVRYRFRHLLRNAGSRLARLPSDCALRSLDRSRPVMCIPRHVTLLPLLPTCAETPPLPNTTFIHPPHPATPLWHHDRFIIHPHPHIQKQIPHTVHPSKTVLVMLLGHVTAAWTRDSYLRLIRMTLTDLHVTHR